MSTNYYHGSSGSHRVGSTVIAECRPTEFSNRVSKDGVNIEDFVDAFRPTKEISRLCGFFMVRTKTLKEEKNIVRTLNKSGASIHFIYEVKPLGRITKANFSWFQVILNQGENFGLIGNTIADIAAQNYWTGAPLPDALKEEFGLYAMCEYITDRALILRNYYDSSDFG